MTSFGPTSRLLAGLAVASVHVLEANAQPAPPTATVTLEIADWLPPWNEETGGWGVAPAGKARADQWIAFTGDSRELQVPVGRYNVYWLQAADYPRLLIRSGLEVGADGATARASTGIRLEVADWAALDDSAHWTASLASSDASVNAVSEGNGDSMMLPPGEYDIYWNAGEQAALGWIARISVEAPFGGIGVEVEAQTDGVHVIRVAPGGPGDQAGLEPDDLLTAADGQTLVGLRLDEAVALLRGDPATSVSLTVTRTDQVSPLELTVVREVVDAAPTVRADSGVRLVLSGSLPIDPQSGWWGAVVEGGDPANGIPINRLRIATAPMVLRPGSYDLYWQRDADTPPALLAAGVEVTAGQVGEVSVSAPQRGPRK